MDLAHSPFFLLGATMRDDRRKIMTLSEEKSLLLDEDLARKATAILTNPRKRLSAEISWLPGLAPTRCGQILEILESRPMDLIDQSGLPCLSHANALASGLSRVIELLETPEVVRWIIELAQAYENVEVESLISIINEDRQFSGFPEITDVQLAEQELQRQRQYFRTCMKDTLDRLPTRSLVAIITRAVEQTTNIGKVHGPILIDDVVDSYEVEAQEFLDRESENITSLISQIRATSQTEEAIVDHSKVDQLVERLVDVVKNWDIVAQPIQVSARSRGLEHSLSGRVAGEIRELAVELFNQYGLLNISTKLTELLQSVFAEVDRVVEQSRDDASALDQISEQRAQNAQKKADWVSSITFEADAGTFFSKRLKISPDGVELRGRRFSLDEITRVRWGGTRRSVYFIPAGVTYNIFVGNQNHGESIELTNEDIYSRFVEALWRAVGVRILTEMLVGLREGGRYSFGAAVVYDHGVELERKNFLSSNERVLCTWPDLAIGSYAGFFSISKRNEKKVSADLSYQHVDNVHILETAMRAFWKRVSPKLSDLLPHADTKA